MTTTAAGATTPPVQHQGVGSMTAAATIVVPAVAIALCWLSIHRQGAGQVQPVLSLGTAAVVVAAALVLVHALVCSVQPVVPETDPARWRRRGLLSAVVGQDGRASTSLAQVMIWTYVVLVALVDALLLSRSTPGSFALAVGANWRPEYLVLLGLPIVAATVAKGVVASSNGGAGPAADGADGYVRTPVAAARCGVRASLVQLLTDDNGTVVWADLQYLAFTVIAVVAVIGDLAVSPENGLPAIPAALLTLMGVSATGYTANKVVETRTGTGS